MTNEWGDVELDAKGMRALAHPVRVAILNQLQRHGPDTATGLAPRVGASPSVTSWHLRHLAEHGLVEDDPGDGHGRKRWWRSVGRGYRFAADADPGAYQALSRVIEEAEADLVPQWQTEVQPYLDRQWLALSGRANTTVLVTPEELEELEEAFERLLTPYVVRKLRAAEASEAAPEDARPVRLLRYVMPLASDA